MTTLGSTQRIGLAAFIVIGGVGYLGWRAHVSASQRRVQAEVARGTRALTTILSYAGDSTGAISLVGDVPGAPRRAILTLVRGNGADSMKATATLDLTDTLAADTVGGWAASCVGGASIVSISVNAGNGHVFTNMAEGAPSLVVSVISRSHQIALLPVCAR